MHEENRLSWNAATDAHNSHKGDQAAFFRNGGNKLHAEEKALLGDIDEGVDDYVATFSPAFTSAGVQQFRNPHRAHEFTWGIGEIVTALLQSGLALTSLQEYPYTQNFKPFAQMVHAEGHWHLPPDQPNLPLMFSITTQKPS
ncbi:hypothetical protein KSD_02780 [Ktedonobacter sp. SOSP1-85]|uniref:hypothetical protein n=1 Tax=Ktedonobacter sp. SOSP1-85 TaxID=2778367 RepID=UPI0019150A10|nr:hypothetical protein [Ktedonobacter sp. SOSP1-85]GHO72507.1 hypothetical protein KSD_02780 [Ktedonobacter sp. SOSP1-85]